MKMEIKIFNYFKKRIELIFRQDNPSVRSNFDEFGFQIIVTEKSQEAKKSANKW